MNQHFCGGEIDRGTLINCETKRISLENEFVVVLSEGEAEIGEKTKGRRTIEWSTAFRTNFYRTGFLLISYIPIVQIPLDRIFSKQSNDTIIPKPSDYDENEEIHSSDEDEEVNQQFSENEDADDADAVETPQDKRLKLAKLYLEEIEKEEQSRAEDKEVYDTVSQRLTNEYLDSVGKLRRKVADTIDRVDTGNILKLKHKLHKSPVTCVCLLADNKFLFTGDKSSIVLKRQCIDMSVVGHIDVTHGRCKEDEPKNDKKRRSQIWTLAASTDGRFLAIGEMGVHIQIWCVDRLTHLQTFKGHRDVVTSLVFRKDTHDLYSASRDRSVKIWSLDEMAYVETLYGHQSGITGIDALARERAITAGGADCSIRIWKIAEESQLIYNGHSGSIESVRLINEENFLSAGDDG